MKEQLAQRLKELKAEFETGHKILGDLDARRSELQKSLLRISGAIQVLEEELGKCNGHDDSNGDRGQASQSSKPLLEEMAEAGALNPAQ